MMTSIKIEPVLAGTIFAYPRPGSSLGALIAFGHFVLISSTFQLLNGIRKTVIDDNRGTAMRVAS